MSRDKVDAVVENWHQQLPGAVGIELELVKRASRLSTLLSLTAETELTRRGLTKAEFEILSVLRAAGSPYRLRPSDIAQRLLLSSGGTSNLLRRLTDAGLIGRDPHPGDARGSWVSLTPQGVELAEDAVRAAARAQQSLLRNVPEETTRAAIDAMRQLLIALGDTPWESASP